MAFDYKREYKEFYLPKSTPGIVRAPSMNFVAVRGAGDPNAEGGEYQRAMSILYGLAFTIKMSKKGSHRIEGYFDYVVPPLEGFWHQEGSAAGAIDYSRKGSFRWISAIRLPDFVGREDFDWAVAEASAKKREGYATDFESGRLHHEIYLSDARRTAPEKLRTVIRHPVRGMN